MKCFSSANGRARAMLLFVIASSMSGCCAPYILDESLPPRRVDEPYRFRLDADCWDAFWWMSGELPVGMSFGSDGVLKGTPRYAGRYFLTIGWDEVYEGEILTSVSKSFELVIVEAGEALPEWDPVEAAGPIAAVEERSL
jgi:hypothetical protein